MEFANWNSQACIGYGCGNNSSTENSGASDTMPYHTGTMKTSRTTYGVGVQYRYIEDYWANVNDYVDGIYYNQGYSYCINNPANFSDTSNGTQVSSSRDTSTRFLAITTWNIPNIPSYEYALTPSGYTSFADTSYTTDLYYGYGIGVVQNTGGNYTHNQIYGMFTWLAGDHASYSAQSIGSRLMVLPSQRIS